MKTLARVLATWFYCGYAPSGPGTVGSAAAILIAFALYRFENFTGAAFGIMAAVLTIPAMWAAGETAKQIKSKDPGIVVIDEVVGQWITLLGATHLNWQSWLAAFLLFRVFDILKPPPVRQLEKLPGGAGIVADDVMAGIYGAIVLLAAGWFHLY